MFVIFKIFKSIFLDLGIVVKKIGPIDLKQTS